jgi:hypothetical protein
MLKYLFGVSCTSSVNEVGELVDAANKPYKGNTAYIIIAMDGREDSTLKDFAPTLASAAILQGYFGIRENGQTDTDVLIEALKLYNDMKFATEVKDLREKVEKAEGKEKEELTKRLNALEKNITSKDFIEISKIA